jgi:dienelactone hydrolase
MRSALLAVSLALAGCADLTPQARWNHAEQLADNAGWQKLRLPAGQFVLSAYVPKNVARADTLTVYIEGDGLAWLSRSRPSSDPTPRNPVGLELALRHPQGVAVYLARPCQYVEAGDAKNCRQAYWTNRRFAPEVIEAGDRAITQLKRRYGADKLVLVGYSGGGAVAALVAARRNDVALLVTVAGNLDHRAWTEAHHVPPLEGSLNPADEWRALMGVPQRHFVGERDEVVGREVADSYASRFMSQRQLEVVTIPGFDHVCCWVEEWGAIWSKGAIELENGNYRP